MSNSRLVSRPAGALAALLLAGSLLAAGAGGASARTTGLARLATTSTRTGARHHTLIPAHNRARPHRKATVDSLNWSGYADLPAAGQHITAVTGNWAVPSVALPVPPGFSAMWTGIGGYNTSDLIQAGTSQDTLPVTGAQYYAWYEILPASETLLTGCSGDANCTVTPGDSITVNIANQGGNTWKISFSNNGKWTWSKTLSYASTESSAEWILEAPTVGAQTILSNVGTTTFDPNNTFTVSGSTQTIGQGNAVDIVLGAGPAAESTPSTLDSEGDGFNDCAYALSCSPNAS